MFLLSWLPLPSLFVAIGPTELLSLVFSSSLLLLPLAVIVGVDAGPGVVVAAVGGANAYCLLS